MQADRMPPKNLRDRVETYEVYDEDGKAVGRVILPRRGRFLGPQEGTVYLRRQPKVKVKSSGQPHAAA